MPCLIASKSDFVVLDANYSGPAQIAKNRRCMLIYKRQGRWSLVCMVHICASNVWAMSKEILEPYFMICASKIKLLPPPLKAILKSELQSKFFIRFSNKNSGCTCNPGNPLQSALLLTCNLKTLHLCTFNKMKNLLLHQMTYINVERDCANLYRIVPMFTNLIFSLKVLHP